MDKAEKCLERRNNKRKIYYRTEKGYNLVNQAQEMITRERCVVLDEKQILIPGCEIWFTDGEVIDACLLYTSPSPRDPKTSRMPSSA